MRWVLSVIVLWGGVMSSPCAPRRPVRASGRFCALEQFDASKSPADYRQAAETLESIVVDGYCNGAVFYNLGNAWFRGGIRPCDCRLSQGEAVSAARSVPRGEPETGAARPDACPTRPRPGGVTLRSGRVGYRIPKKRTRRQSAMSWRPVWRSARSIWRTSDSAGSASPC